MMMARPMAPGWDVAVAAGSQHPFVVVVRMGRVPAGSIHDQLVRERLTQVIVVFVVVVVVVVLGVITFAVVDY